MKNRPSSKARHPRQRSHADPASMHREALERRWHARSTYDDQLALQTTTRYDRPEPFHRWTHYRQGFSPALVRTFLEQTQQARPDGPILDPFSGTGTTVIECARRGHEAIGVEAVAAVNFLVEARFADQWPDLPDSFRPSNDLHALADQLVEPLHRAALMLAVANRHTTAGQLNKNAPPLADAFLEAAHMLKEDLALSMPTKNQVMTADARTLTPIEDESIAAILTSPPYLSKHDYTKINRPITELYDYWHAGPSNNDVAKAKQVRAHPKAGKQEWTVKLSPAARESMDQLRAVAQPKLAGIVRSYLQDMHDCLTACHRVMMPGGLAWFVVGGARWKDVYIPGDLLVAELAEDIGFEVPTITIARDLVPGRRQLGSLTNVAPRESVIVLGKP